MPLSLRLVAPRNGISRSPKSVKLSLKNPIGMVERFCALDKD